MPNFEERLKKLQKQLEQDAYLIEDLTNLYYLTGQQLSVGQLLVTKEKASLIVDSRYYESCRKHCCCEVILLEENALVDCLKQSQAETLAFDENDTSYASFRKLEERIKEASSKERRITLVAIHDPVKELRAIKDDEEIALLKKAAELGSEGYDFLLTRLEEEISERELAMELEIFWKRKGSKGVAFDPIIAFGANSSMPHYHVGDAKLKKGSPVLMDIGVNLNHYHSDMTRVVFLGKPDSKLLEIYAVVKEAQEAALERCRPGVSMGELDAAARDHIARKGFGDSFTHSLGHGIGLEVHESPVIRGKAPYKDKVLQPGMVVTVEPGIYLPDLGGIRIEDTVLICEEGHENLTCRSKDLLILE